MEHLIVLCNFTLECTMTRVQNKCSSRIDDHKKSRMTNERKIYYGTLNIILLQRFCFNNKVQNIVKTSANVKFDNI